MAHPKRKDENRPSVKDEARRLVEGLSDKATWKDLVYAIHVRLSIEQGLADSRAGRVVPHEEVERMFGLRK